MVTFDVIISEIIAEKIIKKELHKEDYFDLMVYLESRGVWVCISSLESFMHRISEISKVEIWSSIGTKEHVIYLTQKYGKA